MKKSVILKSVVGNWQLLFIYLLSSILPQDALAQNNSVVKSEREINKMGMQTIVALKNTPIKTDSNVKPNHELNEIKKIDTSFSPGYVKKLLYNYTKIGFLSNGSTLYLSNVAGFRIVPYFMVGVGFELRRQLSSGKSDYPAYDFLPVYFDIRVMTGKKKVCATIFSDLGYSFLTNNKSTVTEGGFMGSLGGGVRIKLTEDIAFILEGGLKIQQYLTNYSDLKLSDKSTNLSSTSTTTIPIGLFLEAGILF